MVAAANTGGGAGLLDPNLQEAYSELAWLRQALAAMGVADAELAIPGYDAVQKHGSDPVMSVLRRLDWFRTSVEDAIAPVGKVSSAAGTAADDLQKLLNKADSAWDGEVYDVFRVIVSGLKKDCEALGHAVEQLRTDVDGHKKGVLGKLGVRTTVFEGLDKLTGDVLDAARNAKSAYGGFAERAVDGNDAGAHRDVQEGVLSAFSDIERAVAAGVSKVSDLQSGPKGHTAPLDLASGKAG